ncbi:MAG TPA: M20/M25/M40 family metallo-hydrolase, partial [Ardenticatenaceae bacterium]|nr:M20/M25/M40 family metallo-hydrolase [Ardenticatenaceae bacterium]
MDIGAIQGYIEANRERFLEELVSFCRIPSIAAEGRGLDEAAAWASARLERLGATVRTITLPGAIPILYAELGPDDASRTLLIYNHYDVQPADPLDLWETAPFAPSIREGKFFARGVADNKANFLSRVQAVEAWQATSGGLPLRILWVIEGEEEIGSPHLHPFAETYGDLLRPADGCLWEAGGRDAGDRPVIYSGLKGIAYFELWSRGARTDLHSAWGTVVPNPAWRLVWALSTLKDRDERILIEGFMDAVRPPTPAELALLQELPWDQESLLHAYGLDSFVGQLDGLDAKIKHLYQPTCTICGFESGYTGPGSKTVLPSRAYAKLDFRLVPDLTPEHVATLLRRHLDQHGFADIEIVYLDGEMPAQGPVDAPIVTAARRAIRRATGQEAIYQPRMAGSGPMYPLCDMLGIPVVGTGTGWIGSNIHAPNENIRLSDYWEGI